MEPKGLQATQEDNKKDRQAGNEQDKRGGKSS